MSRVVSSLMVLNASNPRTLIISFPSLSSQGDRVVQGDLFVQGDPVAEQVIAYPKTPDRPSTPRLTAPKAAKVDRTQDRTQAPKVDRKGQPYYIRFCLMWYGVFDPYY